MSNIRPIGDPSIAAAMAATFQSIDDARTAPSGISSTRWRILQCIAKAAPNLPSSGELRLCSGLSKAALAEHVQALQWKGMLEMGGYRLSPTAAAMVGLEQPYPPKDAKDMKFAGIRGRSGTVIIDEFADIGSLPTTPTIIGFDIAAGPDVSIEARVTFGADGKIAKIEPLTPMDPADVPACMRPDCSPPERPIPGAPRQPADLTPALVTSLRAAIPPRAEQPRPVDAELNWASEKSDAGWEARARHSSAMLLESLRHHHPERCGGA